MVQAVSIPGPPSGRIMPALKKSGDGFFDLREIVTSDATSHPNQARGASSDGPRALAK